MRKNKLLPTSYGLPWWYLFDLVGWWWLCLSGRLYWLVKRFLP